MLRRLEAIMERIVARSSRPEWTLLAASYLLSGVVVWAMRSVFGEAG
jgi:hypothetical protein